MTGVDRTPKYLRIHRDLAERLRRGEWPADRPLPAQRQLAADYGVTLMTVRQAMQLLEQDALVVTRHGRGTFPAPPRYGYDLVQLRSFAQDLAAQGARVETRLLAAAPAPAPAAVTARLGAPAGAELFAVRRLRLVDGAPLVLQTSYLPMPLGLRLDVGALRDDGALYQVLAAAGGQVVRADERITPITLGADEAPLLGRPAGTPALLSERVSYAADSVALVVDVATLPGDGVALTTSRDANGVSVGFVLGRRAPS